MKSFVVSRRRWLHGTKRRQAEGLLLGDGKQCCVGIYLSALGVDDHCLSLVSRASEIAWCLPEEAKWLLGSSDKPGGLAHRLYGVNDRVGISQDQREAKVRKLFREAGIKVRYKG